jgi:hypothetical protein
MQSETLATTPTRTDLKTLAKESGPCLSIFVTKTPRVGKGPDPVKSALAAAEDQIAPLNLQRADRDAFLAPVRQLLEYDFSHSNGDSATALFRSTTDIHHFRLPYRVPDSVKLGNRFEVRPLIRALSEEQEFYILALSQKHCRLIHCTLSDSDEVPLPPTIPTSLLDYTQSDQPDHRLENRSHGGQKGKGTQGMVIAFGTGSDADQKDQYLRNFYNALDKELQSFLRDKPLPLVIAGVDYEIAVYHTISEYPALVPGGVQGAADSLKGGELHERALGVLKTYNESRADRALAAFEKGAADRIPHTIPEIVPAAFDGRILSLFVAEAYRAPGRFDESSRQTTGAQDGDDLVETAILETIAHNGDVFLLPQEKMPGSHHIAALLRF